MQVNSQTFNIKLVIIITKEFDKQARNNLAKQTKLINPLEYKNGKQPNDMVVKKVTASFCRPYIANFHYSHIMPDNAFECYAGFYDETLAGVIVYGNGASNEAFRALFPFINVYNCRELMRLWSMDGLPQNTESKLISESLKMLPKEIFLVISFADPEQNHRGIIYQACNFYYCGMSNPSKVLQDEHGNRFHVRTIGSYKRRHPELRDLSHREIMSKYNWCYVQGQGKHRYVYLRGEKWLKEVMFYYLKRRIDKFPKPL